ncbi:IS4 family transposase, partial [Paraburkholderia sp. NMBU_R16]|nr:IS4 family transposase [Paraburkholderia sp. NMBU_R16]
GMYVHATYAVTPQREPLGVLNAWMWSRERKDAAGKRGGIKESMGVTRFRGRLSS